MSVALEKLIDLNLLSHYEIDNATSAEITTRAELPEVGEEGKIYFVEDAILIYASEGRYQEIGGTGSPQTITWKDF